MLYRHAIDRAHTVQAEAMLRFMGEHHPSIARSYTFNHYCLLRVQLLCIPGMAFLFAILQACARMTLEHAMLAAEMAFAETTVTNYGLCSLFTFLETAPRLLRWCHAASHRGQDVEGTVLMYLKVLQRRRRLSGSEVATGIKKPEGLGWEVEV